MNLETKAVADVACDHFSADALSDFLERYDDQNKAVKELAGLIKGFYEHDLHYVADDGFKIATEVLRVVQTGVEGHLGHGAGHGGQGCGDVALGLSASHLGIDHVVGGAVEAQQACGHGAVEGERRAVAGG